MIRKACSTAILITLITAMSTSAGAGTFTVTNTGDSGAGSLRAAISAANGATGPHTISFSATGTISPLSALPALTQTTTLQSPTLGSITLSGASAGAAADGITLSADGCTVRGLVVTGFAGNGIVVGSNGNTIGGSGAAGNVISANGGHGILVTGSSNTIASDLFGNGGAGVAVLAGTGNQIRGGSIVSNTGPGIDLDRNGTVPLDGVTYNDPGDVDTGANGLLNAPVLLSSTTTGVTGRLRGAPNTQIIVDLYNSSSCATVGFGGGDALLATATVTTDGTGTAPFSLLGWTAVASTSAYSATATMSSGGDTSEFSQCMTPGRRPAETLALFNPVTGTAGLIGTLFGTFTSKLPAAALTLYAPGAPLQGQQAKWVMGDWDGDGIETPGAYASGGAFFYTNDVVATSNWTGIWFGWANKPAVAGRLDGSVSHDCIGVIDDAPNWNGSADTAFAMYWTCDLTSGPNPPRNALWLSTPLPTSGFGNIGAHQFVAGDFTGSGVETIAIRRGPYIVWSNLAQYFGMPESAYGDVVSGDWDGDGVSSFGIVYQDGQFFRLDDLAWHTEAYRKQFLGDLNPSLGGGAYRPATWRPGGS